MEGAPGAAGEAGAAGGRRKKKGKRRNKRPPPTPEGEGEGDKRPRTAPEPHAQPSLSAATTTAAAKRKRKGKGRRPQTPQTPQTPPLQTREAAAGKTAARTKLKGKRRHSSSPSTTTTATTATATTAAPVPRKRKRKNISSLRRSTAAEREGPQAPQRTSIAHPFRCANDDHCETEPRALRDIVWVLRGIAKGLGKAPADLAIYDPFYCEGAVVEHWRALGFPTVHHRNEDFYAAQAEGRLPPYDVLVTNPPFSGTHIERLLRFVAASRKPWLILVPNFVHRKAYFSELLAAAADHPVPFRPWYVLPRQQYRFQSPGTRARTSPFVTFWYVGTSTPPPSPRAAGAGVVVAKDRDAIPVEYRPVRQDAAGNPLKRPNPRARKRLAAQRRLRAAQGGGGHGV